MQQKLLGPMAVCPAGQPEFEQAAFAASAATGQHRPPIWMSGRGHPGSQEPVLTRRS